MESKYSIEFYNFALDRLNEEIEFSDIYADGVIQNNSNNQKRRFKFTQWKSLFSQKQTLDLFNEDNSSKLATSYDLKLNFDKPCIKKINCDNELWEFVLDQIKKRIKEEAKNTGSLSWV